MTQPGRRQRDTSKVTADEWWTMSCACTLSYWNCDRKTAGEHVWNVQWRFWTCREKNEIYFLSGGKIKKDKATRLCVFVFFSFLFFGESAFRFWLPVIHVAPRRADRRRRPKRWKRRHCALLSSPSRDFWVWSSSFMCRLLVVSATGTRPAVGVVVVLFFFSSKINFDGIIIRNQQFWEESLWRLRPSLSSFLGGFKVRKRKKKSYSSGRFISSTNKALARWRRVNAEDGRSR